jgi:thiol:disulfide interchange protein DsbG
MVIFADKNGQYLIVGTVVNADGQNLSDQYTQQYVNVGVAKAAYADLGNTVWFSEGSDKAPHKAYIIIDPNCIYCHLLYQEIEPMIQQNQVQVRWVPVGFLRPTSLGKAAKLLYSKDPITVLAQNENNFDTQSESGGIAPLAQNSNDAKVNAAFQKIQANTDFFNKYGQAFIGTPVILYKTADGNPNFFSGFAKGQQLNDLINNMSAQW